MQTMKTIASYFSQRYQDAYGVKIDEMKLHKLMYFAQRESLIVNNEPLFQDAAFEGWRFGPVLPELRDLYRAEDLNETTELISDRDRQILDTILTEYAPSDSWNLSTLSHGEICWKRSRRGISPSESSRKAIPLEDIRLDADRMRERRAMLAQQGLL